MFHYGYIPKQAEGMNLGNCANSDTIFLFQLEYFIIILKIFQIIIR